MRNLDEMIDEVLEGEERDLLRAMGEEPSYFSQMGALFTGKTWWASLVLFLSQLVLFIAGIWMAVKFFGATSELEALRWGIPAGVLILGSMILKLAMWPQMHINRVMRELKLIELQIARQAKD